MRMIIANPAHEIPNISEKDIKNSIIIAVIYTLGIIEAAFVYYTISPDNKITLNWYGGHANNDMETGYPWNWESDHSLIEFLSKCWTRWSDNYSIIMYVCENTTEVETVANKYIKSDIFKLKFINKAKEVFK
jgi:hypothetical protein